MFENSEINKKHKGIKKGSSGLREITRDFVLEGLWIGTTATTDNSKATS